MTEIEERRPPTGAAPSTSDNDATQRQPNCNADGDKSTPYADAWQTYHTLGWQSVLPLPARRKKSPPRGFTGAGAAAPSYADMMQWAELYPDGNIALRLPDGVIGIDIDHYGDKTGGDTIAEHKNRWGPLPAAPRTTSRTDGISGIRLYRVPPGTRLVGELPDVEIIQPHHRYAIVWPSIHPGGRAYRWLDTGDNEIDPPRPDDLPNLPHAWVEGLTDHAPAERANITAAECDSVVRSAHTQGNPSRRVADRVQRALGELQAKGSRHAHTRDNVLALLRMGKQNEAGVAAALADLGRAYIAAVADRATPGEAADEFRRMIARAGALLATADTYSRDTFESFIEMVPEHRRQHEREKHEARLAAVVPIRPEIVVERQDHDEPQPPRFLDGGTFIFDQPDTIPAVWGEGRRVAWAEGESLMIAGPMGLGKTSLAGLLVRARLGLGSNKVLGLPVTDTGGIVLYLAMDRPPQIARALARQFDADDRDTVAERLKVWPGPPAVDLARYPDELVGMAAAAGADTVVLDSVKDAAIGLKEDEVGAGYNRARQKLIAAGVQLLELHHTVKRNAQGGAPDSAADVYGSTWLTNGTGSIILLSGDPGDPIVGFRHVRQPAEEVGPWQLLHDQNAGTLVIHHETDPVAMAIAAGADGITADDLVAAQNPDKNLTGRARTAAREKARRALDKLAEAGKLTRVECAKGGGSERTPTTWYAQ